MTTVTGALLFVVACQAAVIAALLVRRARAAREQAAIREAEERFRLTLDGSPAMLWTARPDTTLDYLNGTCVQFTGLTIERLRDKGWLDAVHPDDLDRIMTLFTTATAERRMFTAEYRLRRADGAWRWLMATGLPKFEPDGEFSGYIGCDIDITERKDAESLMQEGRTALEASHLEIQQLAGRLLTAYEDERRRLARELHDDLTQRLARLAIDAGRIECAPGAQEGVASIRAQLVRLSEDVHAMSYRLHPSMLDDLGLAEALRAECDRVSRHTEVRIDVEARDVPRTLTKEASLCLFRVAQEALNNVARHARASAVTVVLSPSDDGLRLAVSDNGQGFDGERSRGRASLGLASMRERVRLQDGRLDIESRPGHGTTVVAWVPA